MRSSSRLRERTQPTAERISKEVSMLSTALGVTAATWAVLMALSPLLQVKEIVRRGSSEGVSLGYFAVLLVGFALWVAYGLAGGDVPLVVPNTLAFAVTAATIAVVLRHRRPAPE